MIIRFEWSALHIDDTEELFKVQDELVSEHQKLTEPYTGISSETWKRVLGYPEEDARRLEFIKNMPSASTKHGKKLHCLKLTGHYDGKASTVGFIEFEVRKFRDALSGLGREIYIRSIVVQPYMRRRGCGKMLYDAMIEYLGSGQFDVIRLCVMGMNHAAISLYFKLGFKITRWYFQRMGDTGSQEVFFCMTKLQGERLDSAESGGLPMTLQGMSTLFKEQVLGEVVHLASRNDSSRLPQRARITKFDPSSEKFALELESSVQEETGGRYLHDVCVNDLFSTGQLSFERPLCVCLDKSLAVRGEARQQTAGKCATPSPPDLQIARCHGGDSSVEKEEMASTTVPSTPTMTPQKCEGSSKLKRWLSSPSSLDQSPVNETCEEPEFAVEPSQDGRLSVRKAISKPRVKKRLAPKPDYAIDFLLHHPSGRSFKVGPDTRLAFLSTNPKRPKTKAWRRYESYKVARTVLEYCQLHSLRKQKSSVMGDLDFDVRHGYCKCPAQTRISAAALQNSCSRTGRKINPKCKTESSPEPKASAELGSPSMANLSECKASTPGQICKISTERADQVREVLLSRHAGGWLRKRLRPELPSPDTSAKTLSTSSNSYGSRGKTVDYSADQTTPLKRIRGLSPGSLNLLHEVTLQVHPGGKINVGLEIGHLGLIVRDLKSEVQPDLQIHDVIVSVDGMPLLNYLCEDVSNEEYKRKVCSKLKDKLGMAGKTVRAVVGSLTLLRDKPLAEVQLTLDKKLQFNSPRCGA